MRILFAYRSGLAAMILAAVAMTSCSSKKLLQDGGYLLTKNSVSFTEKNPGISTSDLYSIAKPKPNKRFVGTVRMRLLLYNLGTGGKESSKFKTWLREKAGERPAIYDSMSTKNAAMEMEQYLNKVGYFYSDVSVSSRHKGKYKIHVNYRVDLAEPYRISQLTYDIPDSIMAATVKNGKPETKLSTGMVFNAFDLDDERDRISKLLNDNGYYYFGRDFVYFEVDSSLHPKEMSVRVKIKPNQVASEEEPWKIVESPHKRYFIRNIYIRSNYDPLITQPQSLDTTVFTIVDRHNRRKPSDYYVIHSGKLKVNPSTLAQSVFIRSGSPYRYTDVQRTRSRFNELGLFSYSNIRFKPVPQPDSIPEELLDCNIDLTKKKLHSFTVETEATNSGGRPGVGVNFTYQNMNIFNGSEIFRLKTRAALEAQKIFGDDADYSSDIPFFNTVETGIEASVIFPRFLIPIKQERFPKYFRPKTTLTLGLAYENRPEYYRWVTNFSFGYDWKESDRKRHQLFPFDWSLVNISTTPEFQETIDNEPNDRIKYQYTDNMVLGLRYAFTYNTQDIKKIQNFFYFRGTFETAGNVLNIGNRAFGGTVDTLGNYTIFGVPYAQFVKLDGDFRFFNVISRNNAVAYRFFLGAGLPYSNSETLPLEKGFYGGGSNGMRGWPYRLLGPGSYSNPDDNFDKMGDVQLEANIEYRFPVYQFIKSALFADFGNIWLLKDEGGYTGGDFKFNRFYKEFAIDVGLGVRLDFNFFILRVDFAIPLRDPAMPDGERWVLNKWQFSDFIINFGIGYPF